jgi:putative DNA primase/helicase
MALRKAGAEGIVFLADNDGEGRKRAEQNRQAAAAAGLRFLLLEAEVVWPGIPEKGSIDDAPGTPAERVQAIKEALAAGLAVELPTTAGEGERPALDEATAPFRILGWDESRKAINYQFSSTAQLGQVNLPFSQGSLLSLAPLGFWSDRFPATKEGRGIDLLAATDALLRHADAAGVFNERSLRGRGAWSEGKEVVYHLGDRLWVGGRVVSLAEHQGPFLYRLRDPLPFADRIEGLEPLTDAEGAEVLATVRRTGWRGEHDGLHIAGWLAIATVGGALQKRPQLQVSCPKGSGKTDWIDSTANPLLAWAALSVVNPTEAGLRQSLGGDSVPVLVDESEAEDQRKREGHLQVARYAFDGSSVPRGTTSGRALTFALCSSVALIGINAPILNPADHSRFIQVARRRLELEEWQAFVALRPQSINTDVGERLLLRMLTHFGTLQRNIAALAPVIARRVGGDTDSRNGEVYGTVLAGVRLLCSTVPLDEAAASRWLDEIGWALTDEDGGGDAQVEEESEAQQCLEHLLGYRVRWKEDATGEITVRELLEKARTGSPEAEHALARLGVKADQLGRLVVSNKSSAFSGTKWRDGAHRDRLRELPGAEATGSQRFAGGKVDRCTALPCSYFDSGLGF